MNWLNIFKKNKGDKRYAIIDISDQAFEQQVIRRSYKSPVMVDFWAPWCGPCRHLGPVLEKIAEDPSSEFILAKLNTEQNQRAAAQYNIRSIPAVKMFRNGQVVGEFTGALPEVLVRRFIAKSTKGEAPAAPNSKELDPPKRLQQAAQHLKKGRGFEAFILLNDFPEGIDESETAVSLLPLAQFLFDMENGDALTNVDALDKAYRGATQSLQRKKPAAALENLLSALEIGAEMDRPYTTNVIQAIFTLLGKNHKITQQYQAKLNTAV